jgi:hypothetical protein
MPCCSALARRIAKQLKTRRKEKMGCSQLRVILSGHRHFGGVIGAILLHG